MRRGDLSDMSGKCANVGFHGFDAREEVGVGQDCWASGDVLDVLTGLHSFSRYRRRGRLAVARLFVCAGYEMGLALSYWSLIVRVGVVRVRVARAVATGSGAALLLVGVASIAAVLVVLRHAALTAGVLMRWARERGNG